MTGVLELSAYTIIQEVYMPRSTLLASLHIDIYIYMYVCMNEPTLLRKTTAIITSGVRRIRTTSDNRSNLQ